MTGINTSRENTDTWSGDKNQPGETCPLCGGARIGYPVLPTGKPDFTRVVPCECTHADIQQERLSRIQKLSNLGALSHLTFDAIRGDTGKHGDDARFEKACAAAKSFAREPCGWLVFTGPVNSGKTHLVCAIANEQVRTGLPVFYINTADLLDHLRTAYMPNADVQHDELFEKVKTVSLLVLDDIDTAAATPWGNSKLEQLLQYRYNTRLPTVITMSTTVQNLNDALRGHMNDDEYCRIYSIGSAVSPSLRKLSTLELPLLKNMTFNNFNPKRLNLPLEERQNLEQALKIAINFAHSPQGWLIFRGPNGCGKTHLAAAIANHLKSEGKSPLFIVVADLLDHLRAAFSPDSSVSYDELFEQIKKCEVLILDDFGEQSATSWAQEKLYQLMNYRYNARLATVITTCLSLDEIENRFSSRMVDPSISLVFNIMAPDYRGDTKTRIRRKQQPS
jgi:DNA replication protein DnaC